jgi:hypothetical protein
MDENREGASVYFDRRIQKKSTLEKQKNSNTKTTEHQTNDNETKT